VIIRCALINTTGPGNPLGVDLPTYAMLTDDATVRRAFVDVPSADVPADVQAFVIANPVADLTSPLPNPFPSSLARSWQDHLARRYDLGEAKWKPVVA